MGPGVLLAVLMILPFYLPMQNRGTVPVSGQTAAPFDMTGYWVMLAPSKESTDDLRVNAQGRRAAEAWNPAKDAGNGEQCKAYGAGGVMRLPRRLHITWEADNTLRIDTDTGTQTRRFFFGGTQPFPTEPSWQGHSVARWDAPA